MAKKESKKILDPTFTEAPRNEWNTEIETCKLVAQLAKNMGAKTILEIGVFHGETTRLLIDALSTGGNYVGLDVDDYRLPETLSKFKDKTKQCDFILMNSLDYLPTAKNGYFDFIFVDGNHEPDHVMKEFKLLESKIAPNGILVYHDSLHIDGPRQITEYVRNYNFYAINLDTPEHRGLSIIQRK